MSHSPKRPTPPTNKADGSKAALLHPRNRHQGRYDFPQLIESNPELAQFMITNPYGKPSIDFADPAAVKVFNRALLKQFYGIRDWDIPAGYLCPPIPGRADYLHYLADLLGASHDGVIPRGAAIRGLDIGIGANCIYPLIGHHDYGWSFVGADIDAASLTSANAILQANPRVAAAVELRLQPDAQNIFQGLIGAEERFDFTLSNPPFHTSLEEARSGSKRKWKNLGKLDPSRTLPELNFGGQNAELYCQGGEAAFIGRMATQSAEFAQQVFWFSTLVSKAGNVPALQEALNALGATDIRVVHMAQGQKQSRFVAWTFLDKNQRRAWRKQRWHTPA
ncbi:23S rRNA (adenine(1618)-N(6))-methyltransferase RlmF [Pseudomonas sp. LS44]|uniref:23S rRNA (adenine(1618)-N(6))-methyltransferase RlmF n=1 Tax=Pseudomonas sp. LS44 TaxID=1357074 RepID=UPI00215A657E|nr:23S rRNA (adenine(1618)-N(6))-methyltransferase RlmF [Pseudomonas sp. LS44]UVE16825.1 23S rRNA (adenine(1618)-N(6))-methyltransferase RlmF [Pseudomonas sp. LS44]